MANEKHIFITGTSSGLGHALAHQLAQNQYTVFAGVRNEEDKKLFKHPNIIPVICDVTLPSDLESLLPQLESATNGKGLFALINNAGINFISPFEMATEDQERALLGVNLLGPMQLTRRLLPLLHQYVHWSGKKAKIINISSSGGVVGLPWLSTYHASKFALLGWSQSLRFELDDLNIDVCCFLPGGMKTELFRKSVESHSIIPADHSYSHYYKANMDFMEKVMKKYEKSAAEPAKAAQVIAKLLNKKKIPLKVFFGKDAFLLKWLDKLGITQLVKKETVVSINSIN